MTEALKKDRDRLEAMLDRRFANEPRYHEAVARYEKLIADGVITPPADKKPFTPAKEFLPKAEEVTFSLTNHLAANGEK